MRERRVRKAVFPAAGMATRFLPATKGIPKLLLPLVDKPTIQYAVEEAAGSGIEQIFMVIGGVNAFIAEHFTPNLQLESVLRSRGKDELLERIRQVDELAQKVDLCFIEQAEPLGLGHAVWTARRLVAGEVCACLLPDDVIIGHSMPCLKQLIDAHLEKGGTVVAAMRVPDEQVSRYGIIATGKRNGRLHEVTDVVEKPDLAQAPSRLAILGRYVLEPNVFEALDELKPGAGGEIQLTDAIRATIPEGKVWALEFDGDYYDTGEIPGYLRANVSLALQTPGLRDRIEPLLRSLLDD
jgi:UTP--glucose-1-phosphate uridylyltransferase